MSITLLYPPLIPPDVYPLAVEDWPFISSLATDKSPISEALVSDEKGNLSIVFNLAGGGVKKPPLTYPCVVDDCPADPPLDWDKSPMSEAFVSAANGNLLIVFSDGGFEPLAYPLVEDD